MKHQEGVVWTKRDEGKTTDKAIERAMNFSFGEKSIPVVLNNVPSSISHTAKYCSKYWCQFSLET